MCEYWVYSCGHTFTTPCKLPKLNTQPMYNKLATVPENASALIQYDLNRVQARVGSNIPFNTSRCCAGMPTEPKKAAGKCYTCLSDDEKLNMQHMKPRVEALRIKREGSGNDNWGYSSQGMVGFGQGGNSSWLDQYDNQNGGFGTYLGGGKTMPDKRQVRTVAVQQQQGPVPGMRLLPPGGTQTWPFGPGGTLSNLPSSAGGYSNNSSNVGWGSSASNNVERSNSDSSNGSLGSFANPWANSKSDMGHVGVPGGRLPQSYGNGNFMPQIQVLPQGGSNEAKMREQGFRDRYGSI